MRSIGAWVALLVAACASPGPEPEARLRDAQQAAQAARDRDALWHTRYKQGLATRMQWLPYDGEAEITRVEAERWTQLAKLRRRARAGGLDPNDVERRAALIHYTFQMREAAKLDNPDGE